MTDRKKQLCRLALCLILALSLSSRTKQYPGLSRAESIKQNVRLKLLHLADISVIKLYDNWKWQKKLDQAERYARKNPTSRIKRVVSFYPQSEQVNFLVETISGEQGWMRISFVEPELVHIQAGLGKMPFSKAGRIKIKIDFQNNIISLCTSKLCVKVWESPFRIAIYNSQGRLLLAEPEDNNSFSGLSLGKRLCRESFLVQKEEGFFGGGEQYQSFNHRGDVLIMDTDDAYQSRTGNTYIPIPFLLSSRRWALFLNTYQRARFDLGKKFSERIFFELPDCNIDYYLIFAPPKRALQKYSKIVGSSPLIPRWSLEPWISRRTYLGWKFPWAVDEDVQKMLRNGFPLGVILWENMIGEDENHIDVRANRKTKSDLPQYIDKWHKLGIKVVGWHFQGQLKYTPEVMSYYDLDKHLDFLVRNPNGSVYIGGRGANKAYLDISNPSARIYFWEKIYKPLFTAEPFGTSSFEHLNLDGIKLDFCEYFPSDDVPLLMHQRDKGMRLKYPVLFGGWLYAKINQIRPEGGIVWQRGAGLGAQRVGFVWAGDRGRTWSQFRHTLIAGLNASASGIALWGTDLGGYIGGGIMAEEVYNRAVAFSCFSPSFHDHGSAIAPWEQSERGKKIYRFYARLRYNLIPYIYHYVWEAHQKGLPIIRPLFLEFPEDKICWKIDDQYLLGEEILVAPVLKHTTRRRLYLPEGKWMDFWDGKIFKGRCWIDYPTPLEVIPVFVKKGSAIPIQLNSRLELAGAISQKEKDQMIPAFLVFEQGDFRIKRTWKVFDPRIKTDPTTSLDMEFKEGKIRIFSLHPLPSAILIFGSKPKAVFWKGKSLKEVSADTCKADRGSFWCYRSGAQQIVIYLTDN